MSPLRLRRHRAERLLRERFGELREGVLARVRARLRASGVTLDEADLEAAYAQAWQGLYTVLLEGQQVDNPGGWLVVVTHRRALDEHRARRRHGWLGETLPEDEGCHGRDRDLAAELDDRTRLRQLFEGLRGRLDGREREAATLCYLQGLSRAEAAARMGVSETGMRKLMEGRRPGQPGVAGKVGALVRSIREDGWCEEQGSLMRAFAYGILDPAGSRHELALMHCSRCPRCRAYVASLRGLAVVLPPVCLPWGVCAGVLAGVGEATQAGGASGVSGALSANSATGAAGATGAAAAGTAGAGGAAGGGWLFAGGSLGAKLAVGCVLALGVGAGCVALQDVHSQPARRRSGRARVAAHDVHASVALSAASLRQSEDLGTSMVAPASEPQRDAASAARPRLSSTAKAQREFGLEQAGGAPAGAGRAAAASSTSSVARVARAASATGGGSAGKQPPANMSGAAVSQGGDSTAAEREFGPG